MPGPPANIAPTNRTASDSRTLVSDSRTLVSDSRGVVGEPGAADQAGCGDVTHPPRPGRAPTGYECGMALASVRAAAESDVDEIVRIQAETWRLAYADVLPEAALAVLTSEDARRTWADAVHAGEPYHVFVAREGEWTVGFCAAAHYEGQGGSIAEISALLVEPRWGRRGHGGRLLAVAGAALRRAGSQTGRAWVPEADSASRRFYDRAGWAADGAVRTLDTGEGTVREIRYSGSLDLTLD